MKVLVLAVIAEREVLFYLAAAKLILQQENAPKIIFISFYQPGNDLILKAGFELHDPYKILKGNKFPVLTTAAMEKTERTKNTHSD